MQRNIQGSVLPKTTVNKWLKNYLNCKHLIMIICAISSRTGHEFVFEILKMGGLVLFVLLLN